MANEQKQALGKGSVGPASPMEVTAKIYNTVPKHPGHAHRITTHKQGYDDAASANSGSVFNRSKSLAQNLSKKPQLAKSSFNIKDASTKNSNKKISPFQQRSISTADPKGQEDMKHHEESKGGELTFTGLRPEQVCKAAAMSMRPNIKLGKDVWKEGGDNRKMKLDTGLGSLPSSVKIIANNQS